MKKCQASPSYKTAHVQTQNIQKPLNHPQSWLPSVHPPSFLNLYTKLILTVVTSLPPIFRTPTCNWGSTPPAPPKLSSLQSLVTNVAASNEYFLVTALSNPAEVDAVDNPLLETSFLWCPSHYFPRRPISDSSTSGFCLW